MAKKKSATKTAAETTYAETVTRTAVSFTDNGPIITDKEWGRKTEGKGAWVETSCVWGYLLTCLGIAWSKEQEPYCRRTLKSLTEGGRTRHRGQVVIGGQLLIIDFGYADGWKFGFGDNLVEKPAYVMTVVGGTHPNTNIPLEDLSKTPENMKRMWVRRFVYVDGRWTEDEAHQLRGKVMETNPQWVVQCGHSTGTIYSTDPSAGLGNRPIFGYGIKGSRAVQMHDLLAEFTDGKSVPKTTSFNNKTGEMILGKGDSVPVAASTWKDCDLQDFEMRRLKSSSQMTSEGHAPYYLELESPDGFFMDRFVPLEETSPKKKKFLTFQSVDGIHWANPIVSLSAYARAGVSTEAIEKESLEEVDAEKTDVTTNVVPE